MAKLVSSLQSVRNGIVATAAYDRLYVAFIADGVSMRQGMVYRKNFSSPAYKDPSSIYTEMLKSVEATEKDELYINILAKQFIDTVCEENQHL